MDGHVFMWNLPSIMAAPDTRDRKWTVHASRLKHYVALAIP
jgi:hypothetical protein